MAFMKRQTTSPGIISIPMNMVLLFFFSSSLLLGGMVYAMDIDGYSSNAACSGAGRSCKNIASQTCCGFSGLLPRAVRIGYLEVYEFGVIYNGNVHVSCKTSIASVHGQGRKCFLGHGSVYGAEWHSIHRLPSAGSAHTEEILISDGVMHADQFGQLKLGSDQSEGTCTSTVLPNAVIYSSDSSQGKWVLDLHADEHAALLSELESVEDHKKEQWLQSQGAYYVKEVLELCAAETIRNQRN